MSFVSTKTGEKVELKRGYESRTITYDEWRAQQAKKPATSSSQAEREARTREAVERKGASASNTVAPAPKLHTATTSRGRVTLDPERGYSSGQDKYAWGRSASSRPAAPEPTVDYRKMVELNRMEREMARALEQGRVDPTDYSKLPSSQLAILRNQAQVDLDTDALNQINQVLKSRRAARGQQTFGDRVSDTLSGSLSSYGAGVVNAVGTVVNAFEDPERYRREIARMQRQLEDGGYSDGVRFHRLTEGQRKNMLELIRQYADKAWQLERSTSFVNRTYALADRMQEDSGKFIASAKEGTGALGQLAVDAGVAGTQMGMDALTAALTGGSSLIPMAVRSFGGGAQEARLAGADLSQQLLYGAGSATLGVGTEKISNIAKPFQKMFGKGAAETIAGALAKRFGANGAVQLMQRLSQTAAGRIALSAIGEGGEEVLESVLQPFLKRATYDPNARFDSAEAVNSALVGAILGAFGGVPEAVAQVTSKPGGNRTETGPAAEVRARVDADTDPGTAGLQGSRGDFTGVPGEKLRAPENVKAQPVDASQLHEGAKRGYKPTVQEASETAPVSTVSQPLPDVKAETDPLLTALLGGKKRVDQATLSPEQFDRLATLNEQGVVGMDAAGRVYQADPAEHIDRRSMDGVGGRNLNAFSFDHPELHEHFKRAAEALIADADLSMQFPTTRRYERGPQGRQVRQSAETSAHLRQAMDETGLSRDQIIDAAKRIVEDHGQENAAAAKRVEIILDAMLENGWTAMTGKSVPPNQEYIDAKSRIAGSRGGETRESYIPPELDADDGLGAADAGSLNSDYDRLQAQSDEFHPEGANAARPVDVPTKDFDGYNIPKSASTMMGAQVLHDADVVQLEQMVADGILSFGTIHDGDAVLYGNNILQEKGFDAALEQYRNNVHSDVATKGNVALGQLLMRQAAASGNTDALAEIFTLYAANSTTIAQAMQAQSLLRKLPPESQLVTVQKALNALNEKYGTDIQIEGEDAKAFLDAGTQEEREAVRQEIVEKASHALPSTFKAKFDTWRYLAMLGNPRTHIRNITGNLFFQPLAAAKNRVGALEEVLVNSVGGGKLERTKSLTGANPFGALAREARADWANAEAFLGRSSKYTEGQTSLWEIEQRADPFRDSSPLGKAVGWAANKNGALLEAEDTLFKRWIYSQSLAGYLKANGVKSIAGADPALLNRARNYAAQEALRNTFNDKNVFSDAVAQLGRARNSANPFIKGAGYLVEGVLPFKRTPANVLARGAEYSPVGAVASMLDMVHKARTGQATAETVTKGLDRLAAGLSGSALLAAGFLLGGAGYITGGEGEDKDQNAFNDLTGHQDYALELQNGTSVTLDWMAPEAIPFFMGVELQKALMDRGLSVEDAWNVVKNTSAPMLEMSMLQGLNDMFESAAYAKNKGGSVLGAVVSSAFTNYFTQALPTLFGQLERTVEDRRMTTYTDKNSSIPKDTQYLLGKAGQKIPGWDYQQIPYIDAWGREEETGDVLTRILQNTVSPGYASTVNVNAVEKELQRVKDATGDGGVFPERAGRYITVDGERKDLTAEEYLSYAKKRGQTALEVMGRMTESTGYQNLDDEGKAQAIKDVYSYADALGKMACSDYRPKSSNVAAGVMQSMLPPEVYILYKINSDRDGNGSTSGTESALTLMELDGLTDKQRGDAWSAMNNKGETEEARERKETKNPFTGVLAGEYTPEEVMAAWGIFDGKGTKEKPYTKEQKKKDLQEELGISAGEANDLFALMKRAAGG